MAKLVATATPDPRLALLPSDIPLPPSARLLETPGVVSTARPTQSPNSNQKPEDVRGGPIRRNATFNGVMGVEIFSDRESFELIQQAYFTVNSVSELESFYRQEMKARGWIEADDYRWRDWKFDPTLYPVDLLWRKGDDLSGLRLASVRLATPDKSKARLAWVDLPPLPVAKDVPVLVGSRIINVEFESGMTTTNYSRVTNFAYLPPQGTTEADVLAFYQRELTKTEWIDVGDTYLRLYSLKTHPECAKDFQRPLPESIQRTLAYVSEENSFCRSVVPKRGYWYLQGNRKENIFYSIYGFADDAVIVSVSR